ncbi:MAG: type II toxin-antitoxin system Phd/YefM family antitoxin [Candidatus Omnitrophica bacterium]|nr:type II toxin-antitoxin system Phd/YefM family antitoxin [Candidatus Omnitrophota bacterium]
MRFVNTVELKNHLNAVLSDVCHGEAVVVTLRGKPAATLLSTSEDELEQVLFERSAAVRRAIRQGLRDLSAGRLTTLKAYATRRFGSADTPARKSR